MSTDDTILSSLGLDALIVPANFSVVREGTLADPANTRGVLADIDMMCGLHHVIESERAGGWRAVMKTAGHACGQKTASDLEAKLAARGQPALAALPLEACLALLERHFAVHGWGRLQLDLTS